MEANQKAMEAEKAALQDKSAKAAIKYFYDFMKAASSHSGHARESWPALKSPTPSTSLKRVSHACNLLLHPPAGSSS